MSKITLAGAGTGTGTFTLASPATNTNRTLNLPDAAGDVVVAGAASVSTANTVTNKIPVVVNGVTYYLLASTSGA